MKTIRELYAEVMADEALQKEYIQAAENGGVEDFLKAHECAASAEELAEFIKNGCGSNEPRGELSDDELDDVAAGKKCGTIYINGRPTVMGDNSCRKWRCLLCGCKSYQAHKPECHLTIPAEYIKIKCNNCKFWDAHASWLPIFTNPTRINN